jgi:hypothetical protein
MRTVIVTGVQTCALPISMRGTRHLIAVEENATGQLSALLRLHGISPDATVLHFDGRPLTPDNLLPQLREVIA